MSKLNIVVKVLCKFSGKKMKDVAEDMGITPVTLSQNLAKDKPRASTFERLAHAFKISVDDFKKFYEYPEDYELTHIVSNVVGRTETIGVIPKAHNYSLAISNEETSIFTMREVSAVFSFMGELFYAYSLQDAKDITHVLETITQTGNEEQEKALMSLLIKQYGNKKEG